MNSNTKHEDEDDDDDDDDDDDNDEITVLTLGPRKGLEYVGADSYRLPRIGKNQSRHQKLVWQSLMS